MSGRIRRWLLVALTVCCLLAAMLPLAAARAAGDGVRRNRALLVGIDDFVSHPSIYPASTNNVFVMQAVLQASSAPFETIMIPDAPVTGAQALATLIADTFAGADADDVSYLYLCTHGEFDGDPASEPVLLLSDGRTEERLTPKVLEAALATVPGVKVVLLDACYSGAFIGKGMRWRAAVLPFESDVYKVIASSGAMEASWYWNAGTGAQPAADGAFPQGAFYFTQALSQGLSPRYGFPADLNRDGSVTLSELYAMLMETHAASIPQVYPQEDGFVVFAYDPATVSADDRAPIGDVTFSDVVTGEGGGVLGLEYIALRPVRVAYQVVRQQNGAWRFDEAQLLYDNVEQYTAFGDEPGAVTAGRKVRKLRLNLSDGQTSGYILLQLLSIENGKLAVHAGKVIAIPPEAGDLQLCVEADESLALGTPQELAVFVAHAWPCQLSVTIVDAAGAMVRRLCHKQSTRPQHLNPEGSMFYWNGRDRDGQSVAAGMYRVRVSATLGGQTFTAESGPIALHGGS
jgi:hypothetical protein